MHIDLTTIPLTLSADLCSDSVVVRTWAAFGVDGILSRKEVLDEHMKPVEKRLDPAAQLTQGAVTCFEFRVPVRNLGLDNNRGLPFLYHDPWEVATGAKDVLTQRTSTWRAYLQIAKHGSKPDMYFIAVGRVGEAPMIRVAQKCPSVVEFREPLPLHRHVLKVVAAVPTTWERLLEDD